MFAQLQFSPPLCFDAHKQATELDDWPPIWQYTLYRIFFLKLKTPLWSHLESHGQDKILCSIPRAFSGPWNILVLVIEMDKMIQKSLTKWEQERCRTPDQGYPGNEHRSFATLDQALNHLAEHGVPEGQQNVVNCTEAQGQEKDSSSGTMWNGTQLEGIYLLGIKYTS